MPHVFERRLGLGVADGSRPFTARQRHGRGVGGLGCRGLRCDRHVPPRSDYGTPKSAVSAHRWHQNSGVPCARQFRTFFGYGVIFSLLWFLLGVGILTFAP